MRNEVLVAAGAAGELNYQAFAHEIGTILKLKLDGKPRIRAIPGPCYVRNAIVNVSEIHVKICEPSRTWNHIASIHGILVFDEAKAIHKLDLGNFTGSMSLEVRLNVGLGRATRKVPEIEAGG